MQLPEGPFEIEVGETVTAGSAGVGSGSIETPFGEESYEFVVPAGLAGFYVLAESCLGGNLSQRFSVFDEQGQVVLNNAACGSLDSAGLFLDEPAGSYTLTTFTINQAVGDYSFTISGETPQ